MGIFSMKGHVEYGQSTTSFSLLFFLFTGAMLSHDNVTWSSRMAIEHYNWNQERLLSYLPLSHVAACLIDCYMSMYAATEIHFADQEALKGTLVCIF